MPLLRIVVAPGVVDEVVQLVRAEPSCTSIVIHPGAALHPPGDVVECQVGRDAVDEVVDALREVDGTAVWMEDAILLLDAGGHHTTRDDAVMWAQVADMLDRNSRLGALYLIVITVAGAIAAVGILEDLFLLIIAAMALSPDYFPLIAGCLAVVRRSRRSFLASLRTLVAGFAAAAFASWLLTVVLQWFGAVSPSSADQPGGAVDVFVASPNWVSVVVACLAGVAGALSVTMSDNRALVGVFVSITTIPAAAGIGVGLAAGRPEDAIGSAGQLTVNLLCLYVVGALTLWAQRAYWRRHAPGVAHSLGDAGPLTQPGIEPGTGPATGARGADSGA